MATDLDHFSAYPIPPGAHLDEELEEREISLPDFAREIHLSADEMRHLIAGQRELTPDLADRLEAAFDIPAHIWLGLERKFRAALATREAILRERSPQAPS